MSAFSALRKSRGAEPDQLYVTWFMFAIGLERLLKVVILLDQWRRNQCLPTNEDLKRLGHDLEKLYEAVKPMFGHHNVTWPAGFEPDDLDRRVLEFTARFSKTTRYYNLDALAGSPKGLDPIPQWGALIDAAYERDIPELQRIHNEDQCDGLVERVEPNVFHKATVSLGGIAQSFREKTQADFKIALARRQLLWRMVKLVVPVKELLIEIQHCVHQEAATSGAASPPMPYFDELLGFICMDKETMLDDDTDNIEGVD